MALSNQNPHQDESIADINITPFVDVVLVLLIIFMITAGVVEFGLDIDVPKTREVASTSQDLDFVNITANGQLFLNDDPIIVGDIVSRVKQKHGPEASVYLRAHRTTPWELVANVVAECGAGGIGVNVVTKPLERRPRRRR